jgi:hypothetical protein
MASKVANNTRPTSRNVHAIRVQSGLCTQSSARSIRMEGAASRYGVMRRRTRILCLGGDGYTRIVLARQLEIWGLGYNADNGRSVLSEAGLRAWCRSQRSEAEKDDLRLHGRRRLRLGVLKIRIYCILHDCRVMVIISLGQVFVRLVAFLCRFRHIRHRIRFGLQGSRRP